MDKRDQFGLDEGGQFELDERGQDGLDFPLPLEDDVQGEETGMPTHENIRGKEYYN